MTSDEAADDMTDRAQHGRQTEHAQQCRLGLDCRVGRQARESRREVRTPHHAERETAQGQGLRDRTGRHTMTDR